MLNSAVNRCNLLYRLVVYGLTGASQFRLLSRLMTPRFPRLGSVLRKYLPGNQNKGVSQHTNALDLLGIQAGRVKTAFAPGARCVGEGSRVTVLMLISVPSMLVRMLYPGSCIVRFRASMANSGTHS